MNAPMRPDMTSADPRRARGPGRYGAARFPTATPVLVLGGKENALSLSRSLSRAGIAVAVSGPDDCWGLYSSHNRARYPVPRGEAPSTTWSRLLLGERPAIEDQHVVIPASDDAMEFVADHEATLRARHLIDIAPADQIRALLDKRRTLELAAEAGIGHPRFWPVSSAGDLPADVHYPVLVKPSDTFSFAKAFGVKFFVADTAEALAARVADAQGEGFDVTVVEQVPGPDAELSSYYTYVDEDGAFLFDFTKRGPRRFPKNRGGTTFHVTEWLPETAREGRRLFEQIGFRGFGNIEFKRDRRDGRLKIMEVNARFTAAQELLVRAGVPADLIVYCKLTGAEPPRVTTFAENMCLWYPFRDLLAFLELHRKGELDLGGWIDSLRTSRHVGALYEAGDLQPAWGVTRTHMKKLSARFR